MKFINTLVLASTSWATPASVGKRQLGGSTENDLENGDCNDIMFIFGRGSTEIGNMGTIVGPGVADGLKEQFPNQVAVQGVDYPALLSTNFLPGGAASNDVAELEGLLNTAMTQCPDSIVVVGGYSQGAALCHRAIESLPQAQMDRIAGVVMFGDTQNTADNGQINNFPADKVKIICAANPRDQVCDGNLGAAVRAPHLSYGRNAEEGADFLAAKIREAQA